MSPRGISEWTTISRGIGRYLDEVESGTVNGAAVVELGALKGFPRRTDDPKVVARALKVIEKQAHEGSAVMRLERWQRVITLRRELARLESANDESNNDAEAFFIANALAWAEMKGVGYGAFRQMGVPVDVLRAAGITRGFEP